MSRGVNKVILIGNLGRDPELRVMPNGKAVCNFSIATSEAWKDKQTGEQKEKTEWHNISTFGPLAEICGNHLGKGSQVYIEGKLQTRKWQDKEGKDRYTTEIIADEVQFLGGRSASESKPSEGKPAPKAAKPIASEPQGGFDDDIPFAPCEFRSIA